MIVESPLTPKQYRQAAQDKMENFRNFWDERFTGYFIGPVFFITHHCHIEWNRKITGERNNAIGFLRKSEGGCRVYFVHTTGLVSPTSLLFWFAFVWAAFYVVGFLKGFSLPQEEWWVYPVISAVIMLITAIGSAISDALTENGIRGANTLLEFMLDPTFGSGIQEEDA